MHQCDKFDTSKTDKVEAKVLGADVSEYYPNTDSVVLTEFYQVDTESFHQVLSLKLANAGKENVLAAISILEQRSDILYVGPNYIYTLDSDVLCSTYPSDTHLNEQWAIEMINLPEAWDICTGFNPVLVGVIDSGIASSHPDLSNRINTSYSVICDYENQYQSITTVTDSIGHGTMGW